MAEGNVDELESGAVGIAATINRQDVEQGARQFVQKINEMEAAADKAAGNMSKHFKNIEEQILSGAQRLSSLSDSMSIIGDESKSRNIVDTNQKVLRGVEELIGSEKKLSEQSAHTTQSFDRQSQSLEAFTDRAKQSEQVIEGMANALSSKMAQIAGSVGIAFGATEFINQVKNVRNEFQQLEISFNTILGSEEKSAELMEQLTRTAAVTPFDLKGVADGAKQLLAYGTAADEVNETITRLGDIAAGLSIPLSDLVYLYGTTMTQGRMFTQDLRQFMGRGIPLAEELAKQFGVTKDAVGGLVSAGRIGADEFKKAIWSMTDAGSKFGGLMNEQSRSIGGRISNIQDAIDVMLNDIGEQNQGVFNTTLALTSTMIEHWKDVADAIMGAVSAYGAYKGVLMVQTAVTNIKETTKYTELVNGLQKLLPIQQAEVEVTNKLSDAEIKEAIASGKISESKAKEVLSIKAKVDARMQELALEAQISAQKVENLTKELNVIDGEVEAAKEQVESASELLEYAKELGDAKEIEAAKTELSTASDNLNTVSKSRNAKANELNTATTEANAAATTRDTFAKNVNTASTNANAMAVGLLKGACIQLTTILKSLWLTLMANPLAIVAGLVTAVGYAIYTFVTRETTAEKATKRYNEELEKLAEKNEEARKKTQELIDTVEDSTKSEQSRIRAFEELKQAYKEVFPEYLTEIEYLKDIAKYKQLIADADSDREQKDLEALLKEDEKRLKEFIRVRKNGTSSSVVDIDGNGIATDNVIDAINEQQKIVNQRKAEVAKRSVDKFTNNIKDMTNEQIKDAIESINATLSGLATNGGDAIGLVSLGIDYANEYSKEQLELINNALQTESNARTSGSKTPKEYVAELKKKKDETAKAYNDFMNSASKLSEVEFERQRKKLKAEMDDAEDKYKDAVGDDYKRKEKESASRKKEIAEYERSLKEQEEREKRISEDLQNQVTSAELSAMKEGDEKILEQLKNSHLTRLQTIKRQQEDYLKSKKDAARTAFENDPNNKDKKLVFDDSEIVLSNEELQQFQRLLDAENAVYQNALNQRSQANKDSYYEYLAKYGEYEEKRLAISIQYDKKIAEAHNYWEKEALKKEKTDSLEVLNVEQLKSNLNLQEVFDDLGKQSNAALKHLAEQIDIFIKRSKNLTPDQIKDLTEAYVRLKKELTMRNPFKALKDGVNGMRKPLKELYDAQKEYKAIQEGAQIISHAMLNDEGKIVAVYKTKEEALKRLMEAQKRYRQASYNLGESLNGAGEELSKYAGAAEDIVGVLESDFGIKVPDALKKTIGGFGEMSDGISQIGQSLMKLDIAGVLSGVVKSIGGVANMIGGIFGVNFTGDYSAYNKLKEKYDKLIASWDELIEKKKEYINMSYGNELNNIAKETLELTEKQIKAYRELGVSRLNSGAGVFSSSVGKKLKKGTDNLEWLQIAESLGVSVESAKSMIQEDKRMQGLFSLSSEQLQSIKENAIGWWSELDDEVKEYLDAIIEGAGKVKDIQDAIKEQWTGTTFDNVYDSFVDTLMNMDSDAKEFSDDFAENMQKAILGQFVGNQLRGKIEKWYDNFYQMFSNDSNLNQKELESLQKEWNELAKEGIEMRNQIAAATGYGTTFNQEASSKGFQTMSQDTANELNGRFTALQLSGEMIKNELVEQTPLISLIAENSTSILAAMAQHSGYISEIRDIQQESVGYLSQISRNTHQLYQMNERLGNIERNTDKF